MITQATLHSVKENAPALKEFACLLLSLQYLGLKRMVKRALTSDKALFDKKFQEALFAMNKEVLNVDHKQPMELLRAMHRHIDMALASA
jgi:hypothetical protein